MKSTDFTNKIDIFGNRRNRQSVWQIVVQIYKEFSTQSTIHGIKYTTQAKSMIGRFLWFIVVVLSVVAASQLANDFYEQHKSGNMRTLVMSNQYPSWQLKLPAITLCHSDVASLHRLAPYLDSEKSLRMPFGTTMDDFRESLKYLSVGLVPTSRFVKELQVLERVLEINNMSLAQLFHLVSPKCNEFIVMCKFEGKIKNCEKLISRSYTPYGLCCSFNYAHIQKEHRWNTSGTDNYSVNFGANFVLSFLIKSFGPNDRISSMMYGDGIKVLIHERNTYPGPTALEFVASSGHENIARLYGRHLTASMEVLNLEAKDRDCQTSLSSTNLYRADNCFVKCRENALNRLCNCLPFFSSAIDDDQTICNVSHISCLARVRHMAYSLTLRDPLCGCLPDCENTKYSLVTTTLPFNAIQFNPSTFYRKARTIPNATAIHIAYSEQTSMLQRRELVLSWINLVSSLGGVFSLFLGCSFISIFEIIYFFIVQFILKLVERRRTTRPSFGIA